MSNMFDYCSGLITFDVSGFDTSKVTDMSSMFYYCDRLTSLDVSEFNTSQVTDMRQMFRGCSGLTNLDVSGFDTSQVTNMSSMFDYCYKLTTIYVSEYDEVTGTGWTTSVVTSSTDMFKGSTKLVGQNGTAYNSAHIDAEYARIDKEGEPGYLTDIKNKVNRLVLAQNVGSTGNYLGSTITKDKIETIKFENGTTMEAISSFDASENQDGSVMGYYTDTDNNGLYELTFLSEDTIAPNKNGQYLFQNLTNVKEITFNNFTTYGVTNMSYMFYRCSKLTELNVSQFDTSKVTNVSYMFYYCSGLTELDVSTWNTNQVTNMEVMFYYCSGLTELDVSSFDTSQVTGMDYMFYYCSGLTELDVSGFDTSQVTNMQSMFDSCSGLTGLDVSEFDTSKVTDMSYMFNSCSGLTSLDVTGFNTSKVTSMSSMFSNCSGLTSLDVSSFDTSQVTVMSWMFRKCSGLIEIDVSSFDTSQVTNMSYMFIECSGLTELDLSSFDTSQVTDMSWMFNYCSKLTELDLSSFDTRQLTDMGSMFTWCKKLTKLDLSGFNTSQVTDMGSMFYGCSELTTIYVSEYDATTGTGWTTSAVTSSSSMFSGCIKLVGQNGTAYNSAHIDAEYARIDRTGEPGYLSLKINIMKPFTQVVTNMSLSKDKVETIKFELGTTSPQGVISSCDASAKNDVSISAYSTDIDKNGLYELTFLSRGLIGVDNTSYQLNGENIKEIQFGNFTTKGLTNMFNMFYGCKQLTNLDVSSFDTSQVTNMQQMFYECNKLTSLNLSNFNTSKVTQMQNMFYNCSNLTSLNLNNFNTSQVEFMFSMFQGCSSLTSLDLSSFDTKKVTDMSTMFFGCSNLKTIYAKPFNSATNEGWTTSAVTNSLMMFYNCSNLVGQNGTSYQSSYKDDKTYARIDKSGQPGYLTDIKSTFAKKPSEVFDPDGTNPDGLHIGDFVNYDAGTWTEEEINSIKTGLKSNLQTANGSTALPTQVFQFGGFTAGSSRNRNATPNEVNAWSKGYNYVKDKSTDEAITGWRVFDIEGDKVTLISAGNPEDYSHQNLVNNNAYVSEYILTGNINGNWSNGKSEAENYQKRNWDMYINRKQYGANAGVLTKAMLDAWYTKYTDSPNADTFTQSTFQKIYQEPYIKYQNMIENFSHYWFGDSYKFVSLFFMTPREREVRESCDHAFGLRVVVTLDANVQFTATKAGTKTVTGGNMTEYGGDQTYNVWDIY